MECTREDGNNYRQLFHSRIIGAVVLTDYNNRTYHIDDVDWKSSPLSTFKKGDSDITYVEYYKQVRKRIVVLFSNKIGIFLSK